MDCLDKSLKKYLEEYLFDLYIISATLQLRKANLKSIIERPEPHAQQAVIQRRFRKSCF